MNTTILKNHSSYFQRSFDQAPTIPIILRRGEKKAPSPDPEDRLKGRKIRCEGVRDFIIGRLTVASSLRSRGL